MYHRRGQNVTVSCPRVGVVAAFSEVGNHEPKRSRPNKVHTHRPSKADWNRDPGTLQQRRGLQQQMPLWAWRVRAPHVCVVAQMDAAGDVVIDERRTELLKEKIDDSYKELIIPKVIDPDEAHGKKPEVYKMKEWKQGMVWYGMVWYGMAWHGMVWQ